jgi:hypothetical protein
VECVQLEAKQHHKSIKVFDALESDAWHDEDCQLMSDCDLFKEDFDAGKIFEIFKWF